MAQIRLMSWNIQVYGQTKSGSVNHNEIAEFIARAACEQNANILVLQELISNVSGPICFSITEHLRAITAAPWEFLPITARPQGDREAYGFIWRGNANFAITHNGNGESNLDLSENQFPNSFSTWNGRKPAIATFRTTDTNVNFAVSAYHAPPQSHKAPLGIRPLAQSVGLYGVDNGGLQQGVDGRFLAGDYNLPVTDARFAWFTSPLPPVPPPTGAGQGAGTTPILPNEVEAMYTHYAKREDAVEFWGNIMANWSPDPVLYRDYQLDNTFYASPNAAPAPAGQVVDLVAAITTPGSALRAIAQTFNLTKADGTAAFPNAARIPLPLNVNLNSTPCAWLLYRYAISDHLPVFTAVTI
jgi:hypothetical protein